MNKWCSELISFMGVWIYTPAAWTLYVNEEYFSSLLLMFLSFASAVVLFGHLKLFKAQNKPED